MRSYTFQRERYHDHAIRLRFQEELSYNHISKIIPVAEETIRRWCIKFAAENPERVSAMTKRTVKPEQEISEPRQCQELPDDVKTLQAELARVKEELRKEKLRADAYDTMIDIAEGMFKVPIRKKLAPNGRDPACKGCQDLSGLGTLQTVWCIKAGILSKE